MTTGRQTDRQTDEHKQTDGQKQSAPDHSIKWHKKISFLSSSVIDLTGLQTDYSFRTHLTNFQNSTGHKKVSLNGMFERFTVNDLKRELIVDADRSTDVLHHFIDRILLRNSTPKSYKIWQHTLWWDLPDTACRREVATSWYGIPGSCRQGPQIYTGTLEARSPPPRTGASRHPLLAENRYKCMIMVMKQNSKCSIRLSVC